MAVMLKIKITKTDLGNGFIKYNNPVGCDAEGKIEAVAWEDRASVDGRGDTYEYCIAVATDDHAPILLKSDNVTELTQAEADTLGSVYVPQIEKVNDGAAVAAILKKLRASLDLSPHLTQEELDAINPDNPAGGIVGNRAFSARLTKTLTRIK